MTPGPFGRARAERFAQLMDEAQGAPHKHIKSSHDSDLAPLVEVGAKVAEGLTAAAAGMSADEAFKAKLRGRLMAVATVHGIGDTSSDPAARERPKAREKRPARGGRRLIVAGTVFFGVLALSGVSAASGEAMPGDALYDVKRSTERAQLALAGSDVNRGQLYLEFAQNRLDEAEAVIASPDRVVGTLDDMDEQTRDGVSLLTGASVERTDERVLDAVDTFVDTQRTELVDLVANTADTSRQRALDSLRLLDGVEERADKLRFSLLCTASADAKVDELGPVPVTCAALPDPAAHQPNPVESDPKASRDSRPGEPTAAPTKTPGGKDEEPGLIPTLTPSATPSTPADKGGSGDDKNEGGLLGTLGGILSGLLGG